MAMSALLRFRWMPPTMRFCGIFKHNWQKMRSQCYNFVKNSRLQVYCSKTLLILTGFCNRLDLSEEDNVLGVTEMCCWFAGSADYNPSFINRCYFYGSNHRLCHQPSSK